jgi:hypothetical protein
MKFRFIPNVQALLAGLLLAVSNFSNAGLITLTDSQNQTVDGQNFIFSWAIGDWTLGTSVDLIIELQGDLGQTGENAVIDAETLALGSHGQFGSGLNGWISLISGQGNEWRVQRMFTLTSFDVEAILSDNIFNVTIDLQDTGGNINGVSPFYGTIGSVLPYAKVDVVYSNVEVPEPSTLAIFALGLIGLASRYFMKKS